MNQEQLPHIGKVALITGAASGIGAACARKLFSSGASVIISDVSVDQGNQLASELNASHISREDKPNQKAIFKKTDLSVAENTKELIKETLAEFEKIDILVNNAGIQHISPIEEFSEQKWRQIQEIMLTAPFLLTQGFLPKMYEQKWGRIINVGSIHSLVASPFKSAYVTAKHGLLGFTKATALEGGKYGVTCNCLCPSYVKTPLVEKQILEQSRIHGIPEDQVIEKLMAGECAVKRLLEPNEVAEFVIFLCSEAGSGITGSAQTMDCGWTAH
ncbi:hypothetical protein K7432_004034 [Basidiobolus ranarum]|uniref:3-oxoacyl-[acyl-carrier-protein] reductase n=1 Tax=Basidiobolus ranarum TaxID=34480 RepID=A0ABR2WYV6_9FUNG